MSDVIVIANYVGGHLDIFTMLDLQLITIANAICSIMLGKHITQFGTHLPVYCNCKSLHVVFTWNKSEHTCLLDLKVCPKYDVIAMSAENIWNCGKNINFNVCGSP